MSNLNKKAKFLQLYDTTLKVYKLTNFLNLFILNLNIGEFGIFQNLEYHLNFDIA